MWKWLTTDPQCRRQKYNQKNLVFSIMIYGEIRRGYTENGCINEGAARGLPLIFSSKPFSPCSTISLRELSWTTCVNCFKNATFAFMVNYSLGQQYTRFGICTKNMLCYFPTVKSNKKQKKKQRASVGYMLCSKQRRHGCHGGDTLSDKWHKSNLS